VKTLPEGMQAHLDSGTTTLCWCWQLTRRDGVVLGFTDHDRTIMLDAVTFAAVSGFTASEVESSLGLAVDNLEVAGALSSATLNEDDLLAGLYDNAAIHLWRVNWADVSQRVLMRQGTLGEVTRAGGAFRAEVRGLAQQLNQPVGRAYGRLCDADLGDARCGVAVVPVMGVVTAVRDARRFTVRGHGAHDADSFIGGMLTFTNGANMGHSMEVKRHAAGGRFELWQGMQAAIAVGDSVTVTPGCDKRFSTCRDRFANAANFRGFPHMPGNDAVLAGPALDQPMDGGSRYV